MDAIIPVISYMSILNQSEDQSQWYQQNVASK